MARVISDTREPDVYMCVHVSVCDLRTAWRIFFASSSLHEFDRTLFAAVLCRDFDVPFPGPVSAATRV